MITEHIVPLRLNILTHCHLCRNPSPPLPKIESSRNLFKRKKKTHADSRRCVKRGQMASSPTPGLPPGGCTTPLPAPRRHRRDAERDRNEIVIFADFGD